MSKGISQIVKGMDLIECNEIVDSDHRGHLIDLNLEVCFDENLTKKMTENKGS